ncbi:haloacid dehalogenase [Marinobacterium nitratireducens]|uniref:Histidinol-phosphatase n=1 Tax=Marinobacterium nitratireducens TaxID=518897 RepID=A0A917ZN82_9GAMM|nr:HAD family hydrolase [Marinobacterium nitratireducens]GGO87720.1 haloacid dehalogenase [Marinobacterium nitratireducens]
MSLAIFDLDHTLLDGDSDHAWGQFLCERGLVDASRYRADNDRFFAQYQAGTLDMAAYLEFALAPLARHTPAQLADWHADFMQKKVIPMIKPGARRLLAEHRRRGDQLLIITATNRFITAPIAARLDVDLLLATDPEMRDGHYTGRVEGTPCFREGKVERLDDWLQETGHSLAGSHFYSDSHNDLPLLERVDHPVAVDPDETLRSFAGARGWPVISLLE